ncbi:quinoprotein relay system zinc metallohydrolase 2 [Methylobacterium marchantiae]|uniref:Quinoprotein relay system zinc metallohydrolase 2 n=1 Tax=Methylobacterium marchantiae TaxID=600331 RepID=A0ABW3WV18_9HYPH
MRSLTTRRSALFGGLCLCCLPTLGRAAGLFTMDEVGTGIFMRRGLDAEATPENDDAIANIGFVVGDTSVLVTETGGSLSDGLWLRSEIRKRTDKPISHVVLTHVHPDHCFGAEAFVQDKPVFIGHHALRSALDSRGDFYRTRLVDILGADRAGSVVYPTMDVAETAEVDLGGRALRFTAHGTAHTNCDLSMIDARTGILFPADLLFVTRIPSLDGSLLGWLKEVETLKGTGASKAVPGHGPTLVDAAPAFADLTRYLTTLRDETRKAIAADQPIDRAIDSIGQAEREKWVLFDTYNGRNVTQAYKELEWE